MSDEIQAQALWFAVLTLAGIAVLIPAVAVSVWWWIEGEYDEHLYAWADPEDSAVPLPAPVCEPGPPPRGLAAL